MSWGVFLRELSTGSDGVLGEGEIAMGILSFGGERDGLELAVILQLKSLKGYPLLVYSCFKGPLDFLCEAGWSLNLCVLGWGLSWLLVRECMAY